MKYLFLVFSLVALVAQAESPYLVGTGMYDITGPVADVMMMGYVDPKQKTSGIHTRLRARAFVVVDNKSGQRVAFVNIDQIHVYQAVTQKVVEKLKARFGTLYTARNILLSATHTHNAPGGFSHYKLYNTFASFGYSQQNFDVVSEGIFQSISRAHDNLVPGTIKIAQGILNDTNVNRSPDAYRLNPASERAEYATDVDKLMTLLKIESVDGKALGMFNWFPVHLTSIQHDNHLISADNKGIAEAQFEKLRQTNYFAKNTFVAAFANSNAGDSSPSGGSDLNGDGNWDCPLVESFSCAHASGRNQFLKAQELYRIANETLAGPVDYRHSYVDFSHLRVGDEYTRQGAQETCYAAIGLSMLAGAKDNHGVGKEKQTCSDPSLIGSALCIAHPCHGEKPVALATGTKHPYPWTPEVLPIQILRIGQLALVAVPAEFTTMSGRRLKKLVTSTLAGAGVTHVVIAGYANAYAGYVATPEEYQMQNYEGASTHFGRWTLSAYLQEFHKLAMAMTNQSSYPEGPEPRDLSDQFKLPTPRNPDPVDTTPRGVSFGEVIGSLAPEYSHGETITVSFWGAYPNHDLLTQSSYLEVQQEKKGQWVPVAFDWDPDTKFIWERVKQTQSRVTIEWETSRFPLGTYRILHRGHYRDRSGTVRPYSGVTSSFVLF